MMQPFQQSSQRSSEKSPSFHSVQVLHHVLNNVLKITTDDRVSFSKWIEYMDYHNTNELCDDLQFELIYIHGYSDYILNGQNCALKFATMNKIKLLISWMSTRKKKQISSFFSIPYFPFISRLQ